MMKAKIKKFYFKLTGKFNHIKNGVICEKAWYGN